MRLAPITQTITTLNLSNTNVPEGEAASAYNPALSYDTDETTSLSSSPWGQGGLITSYISLQDGNVGHNPASSPEWWRPIAYSYLPFQVIEPFLDEFVFIAGDRLLDTDNHRTFEATQGTRSNVTISIGSPAVVTWTGHGLAADTPIIFTSTLSMPTGLSEFVIYYVKLIDANTFNLSDSPGGTNKNTTGSPPGGVITATANPTYNVPITDPDYWLDIGPSNRWAMFDESTGSQTVNPEVIIVQFSFATRIDRLSMLNLDAASVTVQIDAPGNPGDDPLVDRTYLLSDPTGITDWYQYFFAPIVRKTDLIVRDIPPYGNQTILVQINAPGGDAKIGALLAGLSFDLGGTTYGAEVGTIDYSKKKVDDFGNASIVKRAFSKRMSATIQVPNNRLDAVKAKLDEYRATPVVWEGTDDYASTWIYGYLKSHRAVIATASHTLLSVEIEGLA